VRARGLGLIIPACLIAIVMAAGGCAASRHNATEAEREQWLACHGGTVEGPQAERARAEASKLLALYPTVRLRVLECPRLCAYSWPDGTVVVSRPLVEQLSAEELTASVAHELGHLIGDGWITAPAALSGRDCARGADAERRADAIGARVLQDCGLSAHDLASALGKVSHDPSLTAAQQRALLDRIDRLSRPGGGS
jgi:Zn-dependent protease with chaperone function